jgi:hypothetical protein
MTTSDRFQEIERYVLPEIRRSIGQVDDPKTQDALFALLALVHHLAEDLERTRRP